MNKHTRKCTIGGCNKKHLSRCWCGKHYQRWRKHGDPEFVTFVVAETPEQSFALRTEWQGDCLVWTGTKDKDGYGHIRDNGKTQLAHRFAWWREHGEISEGKIIDHTCHNKACVNIHHLRLATASQNSSHLIGAQANGSSGIRNVYQSYDKWQVRVTKNSIPHSFGVFDDINEAAEVAEAARKKLFGEFAGKG